MSKSNKSSAFYKLRGCDQLEARYVLAANPIITEFMASNGSTLLDEDGDSSDWIEIYNAGDESLDLAGWHLTDDADELSKWRFPLQQLDPGDFLVVFASDKDRALPNSELHTNFKLSRDGEYLALVQPDAGTVAFEFAPEYVEQQSDVSYGVAQQSAPEVLVDDDTSFRYIIPDDSSLALDWTQIGFDDAGWSLSEGTSLADDGLGYENTPSHYAPFIDTTITGGTVTLYARYEFDVTDPSEVDSLVYSAIYDDGFIAYLNGTRIEAQNAPQTPDFDSIATSSRGDLVVIDSYVDFDVSQYRDLLQTGNNVLAIHALNRPNSSDMLFIPRLEGLNTSVDVDAIGFLSEPTPGAVNSFTFDGFVDDVDFSSSSAEGSDPSVV
ncbi:MAG: lamin tail domain-containing protein [Planctomycetota bacterium]